MSRSPQQGKYQIGTVARATGLSTHTLRVWERRYGVVSPARTPGGSRVYSDTEVIKLRLLKRLTGEGHSIGRIAHLSIAELEAMAAEPAATAPPAAIMGRDVAGITRQRFLEALACLDMTAAERVLLYAVGFLDPRAFLLDVAAPILDDIGARWERGDLRIAHEHAASALLRNLLGTLMRTRPPRTGAATAVAATPSGELHELGVLMAALMAVLMGWKVLYLGPSLPADEILHVLDQSDAAALLLSLVNAPGGAGEAVPGIEAELARLVRGLRPGVDLVAGGRSAPRYAHALGARAIIAPDLAALDGLLARARH